MDNPGGICIGFSGPSSLLSHTSLSHPHPLPIHQKFPIFLPRSDILALGPKSGLGQINTRLLRSYPFSLSPWQSASLRVSEGVVWSQKKKKNLESATVPEAAPFIAQLREGGKPLSRWGLLVDLTPALLRALWAILDKDCTGPVSPAVHRSLFCITTGPDVL